MRRGAGLVAVVGAAPADEDLVLAARAGDEAAMRSILDRYRSFARAKARLYYVAGGDRDDVVQEGMIGLFKAVRDFDENAGASFRAFADLCITRQVLTAVKAASRNKHSPLNSSLSLSRPVLGDEEGERSLADLLSAPAQIDPAEQVMSAERIRNLQRHVDAALSDLEVDVLGCMSTAGRTPRSPRRSSGRPRPWTTRCNASSARSRRICGPARSLRRAEFGAPVPAHSRPPEAPARCGSADMLRNGAGRVLESSSAAASPAPVAQWPEQPPCKR